MEYDPYTKDNKDKKYELSTQTVKRITNDLRKIMADGKYCRSACAMIKDPENILVWVALIRGPKDTDYEGGIYLVEIHLNPEYPLKASQIMMRTPNGRYPQGAYICTFNTSFHQSDSNPTVNPLTLAVEIQTMMKGGGGDEGGVGHISPSMRDPVKIKEYVKNSWEWLKTSHPHILNQFIRTFPQMFELKINPETGKKFKPTKNEQGNYDTKMFEPYKEYWNEKKKPKKK